MHPFQETPGWMKKFVSLATPTSNEATTSDCQMNMSSWTKWPNTADQGMNHLKMSAQQGFEAQWLVQLPSKIQVFSEQFLQKRWVPIFKNHNLFPSFSRYWTSCQMWVKTQGSFASSSVLPTHTALLAVSRTHKACSRLRPLEIAISSVWLLQMSLGSFTSFRSSRRSYPAGPPRLLLSGSSEDAHPGDSALRTLPLLCYYSSALVTYWYIFATIT